MSSPLGTAKISVEADATKFGSGLEAALEKALKSVADAADKAFGGVEDSASDAGKAMGDSTTDGATAAEKALGGISEAAEKAADGASSAFESGMSDLGDSAADASSTATSALSDIGGAAEEAAADAAGAFSSGMADVGAAAADAAGSAASSLSDIGGAAASTAADTSSSLSGAFGDVAGDAASASGGVMGALADMAGSAASVAGDIASSMAGAFADMGSAAASAASSVSSSLSQMNSDWKSNQESMKGAEDGNTKFFGGMKGGIGTIAGVAGAVVGLSGAADVIGGAFAKSTAIEDAQASLTIILGDAGKASKLMDAMVETNLTTPYMFDAWATAGKNLAAFGVDAEKVPDILTALGEAASATGGGAEALGFLTDQFGKMTAKGTLGLQDVWSMSSQGVDALTILSNSFDVTKDEMQKMISAGAVPAEDAIDILTKGIMEGTEGAAGSTNALAGTMDAMANTTSGAAGNAKAALVNMLAAGIEPLKPGMNAILNGITDVAYAVMDVLGPAVEGVVNVLGGLFGFLNKIPGFKFVAIIIGTFAAAFTGLAIAMGIWSVAAGVASKAMTALSTSFLSNPVVLIVLAIVAAIAALVVGFMYLWNNVEGFRDFFIGIWDGIQAAVSFAWEGVIKPVLDAFGVAFTAIGDAAMWLWEVVLQPVFGFIGELFSIWWSGVQLYFRLWGAAFEVMGEAVTRLWTFVIQPVFSFISDIFMWLWNSVIMPVVGWIRGKLEDMGRGFTILWETYVSPVVAWISDKWNWLYNAVIGPVVNLITGALEKAGRGFTILWDGVLKVANWIGDKLKSVGEWFSGLKDTIVGAFKGAGKWLWDMGKDIVQGLLDGAGSLLSKIGEFFLDKVPGWIKTPFKKALGIDSPSKLFAGYGQNIGDGLVGGLESMQSAVSAAGEGLAASAAVGTVDVPQAAAVAPTLGADVGAGWDAAAQAQATVAAEQMGPTVDALMLGMDQFGAKTTEQLTKVVAPGWKAAGASIMGVQQGLVDPAMAAMQASTTATAARMQSAVVSQINPAWINMGSNVMAVKTGTVDPAFAGMIGGVNHVADAFGVGASNIATQWNRVREATAAPVRFAIQSVFNDGIVGMWNSVSDMLGTKKMGTYPVRFASGGVLPGYTPGRDPYTFIEPNTGMSIGLSGGEAIMRPEVTRALGTGRVDALNASARMGGVSAVKRTLGGFAGGGVIDSISGLVKRYFPMMSITSTYRPGANDHHGSGKAVDFSNSTDSTPQMRSAAGFFAQNYGPGLLELIHSPFNQNIKNGRSVGDGMGFYGSGLMAQHRNHVHVAAPSPLGPPGTAPAPLGGADFVPFDKILAGMYGPIWEKTESAAKGWPGGGLIGELPSALAGTMKGAFDTKIEKLIEEMSHFSDPGGGSVERWRPLVDLLLARYGLGANNSGRTLRRMNQESGGNPRAINNWDSNAKAGIPSKGLMQVIDPTFAAHRDPALSPDIWDPMANVGASMRYTMARYGSLAAGYDRAGGYDFGGVASGPGFMAKYSIEPERVLSGRQTAAFEEWMRAGAGLSSGGGVQGLAHSFMDAMRAAGFVPPRHGVGDNSQRPPIQVTIHVTGTDSRQIAEDVGGKLLELF